MNAYTIEKLARINKIILQLTLLQQEIIKSYEVEHAIELLKLVKLSLTIDGENRDRVKASGEGK